MIAENAMKKAAEAASFSTLRRYPLKIRVDAQEVEAAERAHGKGEFGQEWNLVPDIVHAAENSVAVIHIVTERNIMDVRFICHAGRTVQGIDGFNLDAP